MVKWLGGGVCLERLTIVGIYHVVVLEGRLLVVVSPACGSHCLSGLRCALEEILRYEYAGQTAAGYFVAVACSLWLSEEFGGSKWVYVGKLAGPVIVRG